MKQSLLRLKPSVEWKITFVIAVFLAASTQINAQIISTVAGSKYGAIYRGDGGLATEASLNLPSGIALDKSGNLYIADKYNSRIRRVSTTGGITTIAGGGQVLGDGGLATAAFIDLTAGVAVDGSGNIYIADLRNNRVRRVGTNGLITTVAGSGGAGFSGDGGPAKDAQLNRPTAITLDRSGNLYIADMYNNRIRMVTPAGIIKTVAGGGELIRDGGLATAANLFYPTEIVIDGAGNLYIADMNHHRIRKVDTAGIISTIAGTGTQGFAGDKGAATGARLSYPSGLAMDGSGNLYIADTNNNRIRKIDKNGIITTVVGTGASLFNGDGGSATAASVFNPSGIAFDQAGNLYIADSYNHRIRRVTPPPSTTPPVATTNTNQTAMVGTPFSYKVNAFTDIETPNNLTYSARINPANGFVFDPATRLISGTPVSSGLTSVTVTATDPGLLSTSTTFTITATTACVGTPSPDYAALIDLYNATGGPNWTRKTNWGNGCSPCGWYGITCNTSGRVTDISLFSNNLKGTLPASLSSLTSLQTLYLYDNQLTGPIPANLNLLTELQAFYLSNNQLNGNVPASLGNLPKLTALDLSNNQLSGSIPASLGSLSKVKFLLFNDNKLSGCFPSSLSALCSSDRYITFSNNTGLPGSGNFASFCTSGTGSCSATNNPPVATANSNQTATVGKSFSYTAAAFSDVESPANLIYSARINPTNAFSFNPSTRVISGVPTVSAVSSVTITATDPGNLSTSTSFLITVSPAGVPPEPAVPFSLTGVTTVSCQTISTGQRRVTFTPRYAGLTNQPVSFWVVNEATPTTNPGPYTLSLYTDNPVITLKAQQENTTASFAYNWLGACPTSPPPGPNTAPTVVQAISSQSATVGQGFSFVIPAGTFADAQTPSQVRLSVSGLPTGLSFINGIISGTPSLSGTSTITVTATDPGNLSVSTTFALTIKPAPGVPNPTGSFSITGVTTVSCQNLSTGLRRVTFTPRYAGQSNQPISFGVTNEMVPTTNPGPYTLNLYTDNPAISLNALQGNSTTTFRYNWLANCPLNGRLGAEPATALSVLVLGNPVTGESIEVEVRGAAGQTLQFQAMNSRGQLISQTTVNQADLVERSTVKLEQSAGMYFLRISTPTQRQVVKVIKP